MDDGADRSSGSGTAVQYTERRFSPMADAHLVATFFLQIAVILLVCRLVGWCAQKLGQPQVVGEMVAGFLMGPSFFGWLAPQLQATIFPAETKRVLFVVSQLGLVLYMFCVGLEFRLDADRRQARRAAAVSIAGIVVPVRARRALLATGLYDAGGFFSAGVSTVPGGAVRRRSRCRSPRSRCWRASSTSAASPAPTLGTLALAAGAIDDAVAWIGFGGRAGQLHRQHDAGGHRRRRRPALRRSSCSAGAPDARAAECGRRGQRHASAVDAGLHAVGARLRRLVHRDWSASTRCSARSCSGPRSRAACCRASCSGSSSRSPRRCWCRCSSSTRG